MHARKYRCIRMLDIAFESLLCLTLTSLHQVCHLCRIVYCINNATPFPFHRKFLSLWLIYLLFPTTCLDGKDQWFDKNRLISLKGTALAKQDSNYVTTSVNQQKALKVLTQYSLPVLLMKLWRPNCAIAGGRFYTYNPGSTNRELKRL